MIKFFRRSRKLCLFFIFYLLLYLFPIPYALFPSYAQDVGPAGILQLQQIIQRLINVSVGIAFFASTAMLVWGAIKFVTSGGEPKAIQEAWQVITWALLGIVFLVMAWLVLLVIEASTGVKVTQFCLGFPGAPTNCPK